MCPLDALPDHLNPQINPDAWKSTDEDVWWKRWMIPFIGWTAFGPRSKHWWAKWREFPYVIFAKFGEGLSRWETSGGELAIKAPNQTVWLYQAGPFYLTRVQYWCKWHVAFQWPLFFSFHYYTGSIGEKVIMGYVGAKRDADRVYWVPSIFLGGIWK